MEEPAPEENALYLYFSQLLEYGAAAARASCKVVLIALIVATTSWLLGIYVLGWDLTYGWILTSTYGVFAILPILALTYYFWILSSVKNAPEQLASFKDTLDEFRDKYPKETKEVLSQKFSSLGKWQTYRFIGRVLKSVISSVGDVSSIGSNLKTLSAMGNPLFWLTLVISVVLSFIVSGVLLSIFLLILVFGG